MYIVMACYGLVAGLLASLAISAIIMLAEGVASLPSGTFYSVLAAAVLPSQDQTPYTIGLVFAMHLTVGALIGLGISCIMFAALSLETRIFGPRPRSYGSPTGSYAPVWGLVAGLVLWAGLFLPITYGLIIPLLNSSTSNTIASGHSRTGELITLQKSQLLSIIDQVIIMSFAFHLFYGMMTTIIIRTLYDARMRRAKSMENQFAPVHEFFPERQ
jgi:hypothetical protein